MTMTTRKTHPKKESPGKIAPEVRTQKEQMTPAKDIKKSSNTQRTVNRSLKRSDKPFLIL